jgi:hypothetical protein
MEKKQKTLSLLLVALVVFTSLLVFFYRMKRVDVLAEVAKLSPDETTVQVLKYADCKTLEKSEKFWIVKDCNGDYYFKIFLVNNGYVLGYCTSWSTPREAVLKLKYFIGDCVDLNAEDKDLTSSGMRRAGLTKYSACGREIIFRDECIVGV